MEKTNSKKFIELNTKKHNLIRKLDSKEIDIDEYETKMNLILSELKEEITTVLNTPVEKNEVINNGDINIVNEVKKQMENETKVERKPVKNSKAGFIEKVLMMKTIKNIDDASEKVVELIGEGDVKKIKSFIKTIIRQVKLQKQKRWQSYNWDEEAFLLTKKE